MSARKLMTIDDLASLYNMDLSSFSKKVRKLKLATVPVIQNGKACKALAPKEIERLERNNPILTLQPLGKDEIPVLEVAKERKQETGTLLKLLKKKNFKLEKRVRSEGRPVYAMTKKECDRLMKEFPIKPKL